MAPTEFCRNVSAFGQGRILADHQHAVDDVGMPVQVLGARMHDQVEAEIQRPLQIRCGKGIVGRAQHAAAARDGGQRRQVGELEHRIARRFHPDQSRARPDRLLDGFEIAQIDEGEGKPRRDLAHAREQAPAAAVQIIRCHHVIARAEQLEQSRCGRQSRGESESAAAILEVGNAAFIGESRRVLAARVLEALVHAGTASARKWRSHRSAASPRRCSDPAPGRRG